MAIPKKIEEGKRGKGEEEKSLLPLFFLFPSSSSAAFSF
jgi:hypothetical protein